MSESTDLHHAQVDEYVTDPIRVSLRASIDDDRTAYLDLDKLDRHSLFEAKTLDIWDGLDGPRLLDHEYNVSRTLPNRLFDAWHESSHRGERLCLRLLVTRPVQASNGVAWVDDLGRPDHRQINYLPFLPESVEELIHQYDLPREWTWLRLMSREVGNFSRKTEWDFSTVPPKAVRMGIVIHFPFVLRPAKREDYLSETKTGKTAGRRTARSDYNPWRDDPFIWSLAMSHSLRDGKTRGLLDGLTDYAYGDLSHRILKAGSHYYQHPLHVPAILLNVFFDHAAWEVNRLAKDVAEFEYLSRDAQVSSLDKYDAITTELQYARRNLDFQESLAKFLLETMTFLEQKIFTRQAGQNMSEYISYVYETNPHMEEKLSNTLHLIENNLSTIKYLQARTKDALDYINGAIRLRDNEANERDADSNKVMSLLQMTFLPATGVAAIMSLGAFNWDKDPPGVTPSIWVFWVWAVALTVLVLAIYYGNIQYKRAKDRQKERDAKEKEDREHEEIYRPPGEDLGGGSGGRRRKRKSNKPEAAMA